MTTISSTIWTSFGSALMYYFIMAITPGPNNIILANSGLNFGYLKSLKLIVGILIGVNIVFIITVLGFSRLFETYKIVHAIISILGIIFLVYLGFKMAVSKSTLEDTEKSSNAKPLSILTMILLQFSNIKSLMVTLSIASIYHKSSMLDAYIFLFSITLIPIVISANVWIIFGSLLSSILTNPKKAQLFNVFMGSILILYSLYLLIGIVSPLF